jgi:Tfp pilus assembly protein PilV
MRHLNSPRAPREGMLGATLIEAMIACVVLSAGTAAVTQMLANVHHANRTMNFQTLANELGAEFGAQLMDARCDTDALNGNLAAATVDPGLWAAISNINAWQQLPAGALQSVGETTANPLIDRGIPLRIRYRVTQNTTQAGLGPPTYNVELEIRQTMFDVARDNLAVTTGYWIRNYPLKKICNRRMEANGRGEL